MKRTTIQQLNDKLTYTNQMLNTDIENQSYNGFEHLRLKGENLFTGTKKECISFLDGLVQYQLLNA